jgi:flagellar biosynthesis/type III secretory pathway protein FliH
MASAPEHPVDDYQWKKFTAFEAPKVLSWMVGGGAVIEPEPEVPDLAQLGFDEGYAKGVAAGEADALAKNRASQDQLNQIVDECRRFLEKQRDENLAEAAAVMTGLFRALFDHELQTSEHMLQAMIDQTRQMCDGKQDFRIHLNASDYNNLSKLVSAEIQEMLVADEKLPVGVVQASAGQSIVELDVVKNMRDLLRSVDLHDLQDEVPESAENSDE